MGYKDKIEQIALYQNSEDYKAKEKISIVKRHQTERNNTDEVSMQQGIHIQNISVTQISTTTKTKPGKNWASAAVTLKQRNRNDQILFIYKKE